MKTNNKHCQKCGAELTNAKAKICSSCGAKIAKPVFKKWWFWAIIILGVIVIGSSAGGGEDMPSSDTTVETESGNVGESETSAPSGKTYEEVDLQKMLDELNDNALKAEKTYQNKYIEVTGRIAGFDSDGSYITIEPVYADEWNFETVTCYIKKDAQLDFLLEKAKGDTVTIKGKVVSIGEFLGYSMNIDEIE